MSFMQTPDPRPRATTSAEAEAMIGGAIMALNVLEPIIAEETALLRDGRMKEALDLSEQKAPAAQHYQRALEDLKANAIALGRFAPPSLAVLKERHAIFAELMGLNMAVLGTAKTVSESIIRELASDMGQARSPQGYGAYGQPAGGYKSPVAPLAVSKTL